jgi:hypothetical protein
MSIPALESTRAERLQGSNELVGFAVNRIPINDLIDGARKSYNPSALGEYTAKIVIDQYKREIGPTLGSRNSVLSYGARDAAYFIEGSLEKIPHNLTFEQALNLFRHPTSVETLALMAMHANDGENSIHQLIGEPGHSYMPRLDNKAIIPAIHVTPGEKGCPVAGDYEKGTVMPTPLFRKFAVWSGELALRTFHYRDV